MPGLVIAYSFANLSMADNLMHVRQTIEQLIHKTWLRCVTIKFIMLITHCTALHVCELFSMKAEG